MRQFLILIVSFATPLFAGNWHTGSTAVCSDCHTQHNSAGGLPMRTDNNPNPAPILLRGATPLDLCLSCHEGTNPSAPDVIAPVGYLSESAAGPFPNPGGIDTTIAHHLNSPTAEVPPGGSVPMILTCTTCHDPHGNDNYRNLRPDPLQKNVTGQTVVALQFVLPNGSNPAQVYTPSNIIYKGTISTWCAKCHTDIASSSHSVDKPIWGSQFASYTAWTSLTYPRVPSESPLDNTVPSTDDRVTCLSCHKAHGSLNPSATIYADGATIDSTCQECHNQ